TASGIAPDRSPLWLPEPIQAEWYTESKWPVNRHKNDGMIGGCERTHRIVNARTKERSRARSLRHRRGRQSCDDTGTMSRYRDCPYNGRNVPSQIKGQHCMSPAQNGKSRQEDSEQSSDVALLIDYENLQVSLKRHFNLTTPKMSLIIQEALEYGRLVLSRAYAPWTSPDLSIDAENLYRQGIDLIYTPAGKNSADVRMTVDAVDLTSRMGNIGTILFVTGDGDLIHPLNYLRQQGNRVVVIGVDAAMSRMLSSAADAVLIYERDLDPSVLRRVSRDPQG